MVRIAGVDIPTEKRIEASLAYIFGVGRKNVKSILKLAHVSPDKRTKTLTGEEIAHLQHALDKINIEGNLRKQIHENIERLKRIGAYRGIRHALNLPVRGQRTRTNARTKRGKRRTIGAMKKETLAKTETVKKEE